MKVVIIGAGRMGVRHAQGIDTMTEISEICLTDISENSLIDATKAVANSKNIEKFKFIMAEDFAKLNETYDIAIIASTAGDRLETLSNVIQKKVKHVLLEKPLGQSVEEVKKIKDYLDQYPDVQSYVNFSMRLTPSLIQLKKDLQTIPQMIGPKTISVNTGAIGIGANGIHLLDMCFFLFDADRATIVASEIEEIVIPSGRGPQFNDFGGWSVIKFYKNDEYQGKLLLSISATSTPFGPIEIIGSHGRIHYDEVRETRIDSLRNENSELPVYRYHGDYLPDSTLEFVSLTLSQLTHFWIDNLIKGERVLPEVKDSVTIHEVLFDWLSKSKTHSKLYPIT